MTELHPARLTLLLLAVAFGTLFAIACSGGDGDKETANTNPGSDAPTGFSATVYASPT